MDKLSLSSKVGFESEYMEKGLVRAPHAKVAELEVGWEVGEGEIEFVFRSIAGSNNNYTKERIVLEYERDFADNWELETGMIYHWFPNNNPSIDRTQEFFVALEYEKGFWGWEPEVLVSYDIALEQWMAQGNLAYKWKLEKWGWNDWTLGLKLYAGALSAEDANSDQVAGETKNGYSFGGANLDLAYEFNDTVSASVGLRYLGNNDEGKTGTTRDRESVLGWGFAFTAGF